MAAWGCAAIFSMIDEEGHEKLLSELCVAFIKAADQVQEELDNLRNHPWEEIKSICEACKRIERFCGCIQLLMNDEEGAGTVHDLLYFQNYKGPLAFEKSVRTSLAASSFFKEQAAEVVKTAASTKTLEPKLKELTEILQKSAFGQAQVSRCFELLGEVQTGMRKGAADSQRIRLKERLCTLADEIMSGSQESMSEAFVTTVLDGMGRFSDLPGVLDQASQLQEFMTGNQGTLAANGLRNYLELVKKNREVDHGELGSLVKNCSGASIDKGFSDCFEDLLFETMSVQGSNLALAELTKFVSPMQRLMQLKYATTSPEYNFCTQVFSVLKAGLGAVSILAKYESTDKATAGRVGKDSKDVLLGKVGASLSSFGQACAELKTLRQSESGVIFTLTPENVFGSISEGDCQVFLDSLGYRCAELNKAVCRASENALTVADGKGDGGWRAGVSDDADATALKAKAKETIKKLDGQQVKAAALTNGENFVTKFGEYLKGGIFNGEGATDAMNTLSGVMKECQSALIGVASLMVKQVLLKTMTMPATEKATVCTKIQGIIAGGQYGLQESHVHPALLSLMRDVA
eukprot:s883_g7.t1